MRILLANDGLGDAGGVQTYLAAIIPALERRGHHVALLHLAGTVGPEGSPAGPRNPHFAVPATQPDSVQDALGWMPDVAFSHNMRVLDVDRLLCRAVPVVKMMHGYFGTCISGLKTHQFPATTPCARRFGPACLPIHATRRCGPMSPVRIAASYRWARTQNDLFDAYAGFVVASRHMEREYVSNGAPADRVHCLPLFAPPGSTAPGTPPQATLEVLFLGRMTRLKGGDLLIQAAALAARTATRPLHLTLAGDGPDRAGWQALAGALGVPATFPGWVDDAARTALLARTSLLAVPSVWPEPFGLVGLEAAAAAVPAVAFDTGGIGEWLVDGANGYLADTGSVESLAACLVRAADQPRELARLAEGAAAAARRMSLDRHVTALENVLAAAARGAAHPPDSTGTPPAPSSAPAGTP